MIRLFRCDSPTDITGRFQTLMPFMQNPMSKLIKGTRVLRYNYRDISFCISSFAEQGWDHNEGVDGTFLVNVMEIRPNRNMIPLF